MDKRELIAEYIKETANKKEIEFFYNLICLNTFSTKINLLELAGKNITEMNFDTAFPINLYDEIKTNYRDIDNANLIYDYTNNKYGELINVNNLLVKNILNLKR